MSGELWTYRVPASVTPRQPLQPELWNNLTSNTTQTCSPFLQMGTLSLGGRGFARGTMLAKLSASSRMKAKFSSTSVHTQKPIRGFFRGGWEPERTGVCRLKGVAWRLEAWEGGVATGPGVSF